jgi:hypothetical protein
MSALLPTLHRFAVRGSRFAVRGSRFAVREIDGLDCQEAVSNRAVERSNRVVGGRNMAVGLPNDAVVYSEATVAFANRRFVSRNGLAGGSNRRVGCPNRRVGRPNGVVEDRKGSAAPPSRAGRTGMLPVTSVWGILPLAQAGGQNAHSNGDRWHTCPTDNSELRTENREQDRKP